MPKFTFQNPNGAEYIPALNFLTVNPGDVVDIPDELVAGLAPEKWQPVTGKKDDGGNASGS